MTGLFRDREAAERAYGCLTNHGYAGSDVSLLMTDETRQRCFPRTEESTTELGSKAAKGAGVGAVAGGGAFAGGATGGTLGAIVGALVGAGIPEERARLYDKGIEEGGIVIGVIPRTDEDAAYFEREWSNAQGEQIYRPTWPSRR